LGKIPAEKRRELIDVISSDNLSLRQQCDLLMINRSTLYYKELPPDIDDVDLLNAIRDIWMRYPFYGYRRITKELQANDMIVNRKRVQRLMSLGNIHALYPGPNTSKRNKAHAVYPYLLRDIAITRINEAWMTDITYLRMPGGFVYLVALIDIYSRYIIGWSLTNTLETLGCIEALEMALHVGQPEILNSDQGCQFTSAEWITFLKENDIKISMTGKGRCLDNIFIERFWRSFKQEEFYLNEYESIKSLKKAINSYIDFYNNKRWHQSLEYKTPANIYFSMDKNEPMDICTSPSGQPAPFGTHGQVMDNASALPTT
jgi:putative transposase